MEGWGAGRTGKQICGFHQRARPLELQEEYVSRGYDASDLTWRVRVRGAFGGLPALQPPPPPLPTLNITTHVASFVERLGELPHSRTMVATESDVLLMLAHKQDDEFEVKLESDLWRGPSEVQGIGQHHGANANLRVSACPWGRTHGLL